MVNQSDYTERPGRSFLTDSNREFLLSGGEEYSNAEKRQHRYQIRQNLKSAMMDFQLLYELSDKDLIQTFAPLAAPLDVEKVDSAAIKNDTELGEIDLPAGDEEEVVIGSEMFEGYVDLMSLFAYFFGEDFGWVAEQALNQGVARSALKTDVERPLYDVELHPVDMTDKLDEYMERADLE